MAAPKSFVGVLCILGLGVLWGCAGVQARAPLGPDAVALVDRARQEGVGVSDPTVLDDEIDRVVLREVGRHGTAVERITRLVEWLHDRERPFHHVVGRTTDARVAFRERRGDCITHAVLFVALARTLGVDAYWVYGRSARQVAETNDGFIALTHVAVGYADAGAERIVDVWNTVDDWRLARYERLGDASALALYYSNLAVGEMRAGRVEHAEQMLRFLAGGAPAVAEVQSNLAAVLLRRKRYAEALSVVHDAVPRFPRFKALYTNGYLAARGVGDEALAKDFEDKGHALVENDPIFVFARAVSDYQRGDYVRAASAFERALGDKGDSIVVRAWLVRALLAAGQTERGAGAFAQAWKLAPEDARLRQILAEHPELLRLARPN